MEDSHISKVTSPLQELSVLSMEDIHISKVISPFFKKLSVLSMPMEDSIFMQIFL
jgi:hypothetical protein